MATDAGLADTAAIVGGNEANDATADAGIAVTGARAKGAGGNAATDADAGIVEVDTAATDTDARKWM